MMSYNRFLHRIVISETSTFGKAIKRYQYTNGNYLLRKGRIVN
jgi:hypothetical protein